MVISDFDRHYDIAIVGGGIWGLSTAWHLIDADPQLRIVVFERATAVASETTLQAAGQIGQLRSDPLMMNAVGYALDLYADFEQQTGIPTSFQRSGSLHLSLNSQRTQALRKQSKSAQQHGIDIFEISRREISHLAPELETDRVEFALFLPNDGFVDAATTARALGTAAEREGVNICCGVEVLNIEPTLHGELDLSTNQGRFHASQLVVTSGPWTRHLAAVCGVDLPAQPIRLQQLRTCPSTRMPAHHPVVRIPDHSCYLRPEAGGYLYGLFDEEALAYDLEEQPDWRTADVLPTPALSAEATRRLSSLFPVLGKLSVAQYRQGMVTCTPDGKYVIGPVSGLENVLFATGCGGMGIAGSAAVGRWLAKWLIDGHPGDDLSRFSPERFGLLCHDSAWIRDESRRIFSSYYALESCTYTSH
ncbi:NAD(P)/FAD-dependent oxidoreductase [Planctomicrobium sp. SH661]|uniref:NAD(P)/FAD-dependent oxidoreductase n=1 Tax=Planctomicrobium sp. SH661 TaxID=3448124 RepID=UPI003F5C6AF8